VQATVPIFIARRLYQNKKTHDGNSLKLFCMWKWNIWTWVLLCYFEW